ncbi:hypothetical protein [Aeromonas media]|uniref:hypothetical protein n=1 Tax=Aeromonas media TaxID=651 RepID=UPI003D220454
MIKFVKRDTGTQVAITAIVGVAFYCALFVLSSWSGYQNDVVTYVYIGVFFSSMSALGLVGLKNRVYSLLWQVTLFSPMILEATMGLSEVDVARILLPMRDVGVYFLPVILSLVDVKHIYNQISGKE